MNLFNSVLFHREINISGIAWMNSDIAQQASKHIWINSLFASVKLQTA